MRKYMRATVIGLAAAATIGTSAAGAFAADQPAAEQTASVASKHGNEVNQVAKNVKRTYKKTVKLKAGITAKVYKLAKKGHQADLFLGKKFLGTISAVDMAEMTVHNGVEIKLTPNGTVTSWWKKADKPAKPAHKTNKNNKNTVKPGKPSVKPKPEICPPGPKPEICPPGPKPEICPPGQVDKTPKPEVLPGVDSNDTAALSG
ncbi:hypothetical protein H9Y04_41785 [Streptomyces sp. TRM66268-LWL]|uniref:Uncharacterized protein n=1 Tax=Streptomyces polyasparticus TaxID=2767826 RepID=A0ABR7SUB4_9ACTN|nr:hypothetical protein [Streptomyces polyasparticus]MBC9719075.1 hypothetical protein [Streptomyces polyasparticus]